MTVQSDMKDKSEALMAMLGQNEATVHIILKTIADENPDAVLSWVRDNIQCENNPYDDDELGWL